MQPFDGRKGKRLAYDLVADLRFFAFYIGNETILAYVAPWKHYNIEKVFEPGEALGHIFTISLYNRYNEKGEHIRTGVNVSQRIGQYIQHISEPDYQPHPPFTAEELSPGSVGDWREVLVSFMRDFGKRNLQTIPLEGFVGDYAEDIINYGSGLEMLTAIIGNIIRLDSDYQVMNEDWVRYRASQYIRAHQDLTYQVQPRFKAWETALWS